MDNNSIGPLEQSEDGKLWCILRTKGTNRIGYFDRENNEFVAEPNQPSHPSFIVLARNADGIEATEEGGLVINLTILPPWYRT